MRIAMAGTSEQDAALLRRVADGDRAAFRTLFEAYQRPVFRYLVKLTRNEATAHELSNEVMLAVWRGAGEFAGRSAVSTWIFGIAHNKAISALRRRREDPLDEDVAAQIPDLAPGPLDALERRTLAQLVNGLLERLSPDHREVIQLTYYHALSVKQIAEIAGCPEGTVKTRMYHARRHLKALLHEAGVEGLAA